MNDVASLTIEQVQAGLAARKFSALELAHSALQFAQAENPKTSAYLHFCPERALAAAERVDKKLAAGENIDALVSELKPQIRTTYSTWEHDQFIDAAIRYFAQA